MRDEQVGESQFILQVFEQIQNLRLHRYVQCARRLVTDDKLWIDGEASRDADTLSLSTGEFMRIARYHVW